MSETGRYTNASEVVRAVLRKVQEAEPSGEFFPPSSLMAEVELAIILRARAPRPDQGLAVDTASSGISVAR